MQCICLKLFLKLGYLIVIYIIWWWYACTWL